MNVDLRSNPAPFFERALDGGPVPRPLPYTATLWRGVDGTLYTSEGHAHERVCAGFLKRAEHLDLRRAFVDDHR